MTSPPSAPSHVLRLASRVHLAVQAAGGALAPWLDLAMRLWLAQGFARGDIVDAMHGTGPAMAGPGGVATALNALVGSPLGVAIQVFCPILILVGLSSRVAAAALFVQAVFLSGSSWNPSGEPSWAALLGWTVVIGPGTLSLDALLARGLDTSAIPGAAKIHRVFSWLSVRAGPVFRLMLRLWIAGISLAGAAAATMPGIVVPVEALPDWLADRLAAGGSFVAPGFFAMGLLLAFGLGTRACALLLLLVAPIGHPGMAIDDRLYWAVLFGLFLCHGAGPLSVDALIARTLDTVRHRSAAIDAALPHVVILGGGFGGVAAARGLRRSPCRITLVDRNNHHVFQPLLYQVATAGLPPTAIATPIRSLFRAQANLNVLLAEARGVEHGHGVVLDEGHLPYNYLVIATGAGHGYFGRDDWAFVAPGLKRIEDATAIRGRLLLGFERAEASADPVERGRWMTFVIVGGGPTGVEMAGAMAELARNGLVDDFRAIDPGTARIILVQSADRLLPTFPASLSADAAEALRRLGVEVLLDAKVEEIDAQGVVVAGSRIEARTVLWAAGVAASPAAAWLGAAADRAGRVLVGPDLSVGTTGTVFAVGDTAASMAWNGKPVPGLAPAAKQAGAYVAAVIHARLTGAPAPKPFRYRHPGSLATIGRRAAVAEFGPLRLHGALAWWVWGAVHILFLAGGRSRATVILEWVWAYVTYGRSSRLITQPATDDPHH